MRFQILQAQAPPEVLIYSKSIETQDLPLKIEFLSESESPVVQTCTAHVAEDTSIDDILKLIEDGPGARCWDKDFDWWPGTAAE